MSGTLVLAVSCGTLDLLPIVFSSTASQDGRWVQEQKSGRCHAFQGLEPKLAQDHFYIQLVQARHNSSSKQGEEQHVSIGMGGTVGNHPRRQASTSGEDHRGLRHCGYTAIPSLAGRELTHHGWWHSRDHWHSPSPTSELTLLPLYKRERAANFERWETRPKMSSIQVNSRNFKAECRG